MRSALLCLCASLLYGCNRTIPQLITSINKLERGESIQALREVQRRAQEGEQLAKVVPALIKAVNHDDYHIAPEAMLALGYLGADARPAIPSLIQQLTVRSRTQKSLTAAVALGRIGPPAVPALIRALDNDSQRSRAATALGNMGHHAAPAVPHLQRVAPNADWIERNHIVEAFGKIYRDEASSASLGQKAEAYMVAALKDKNDLVRITAIKQLTWSHHKGPASAQAAFKALAKSDPSARVRKHAQQVVNR